jgi:hypothetical protein
MSGFRASIGLVVALAYLLQSTASPAEPVNVRYPEGVAHGVLVLWTLEGKPIADGDSTQVAHGERVTSRMRFRFKDGSILRGNDCVLAARDVQDSERPCSSERPAIQAPDGNRD